VVSDAYEVEGDRFRIRSTSETFGAWIRVALGSYRTAPAPDDENLWTYSAVVADEAAEHDRVGRGFNTLYAGTADVARTLDRRFLARCLLREVDARRHPARDDAVFIRAGVIDIDGCLALLPSFLVPMLCAARRRAEKRRFRAPSGTVAALDLRSGEVFAPDASIELPRDALDTLEDPVRGRTRDDRDRFPIEDGERRRLDAVIGVDLEQSTLARVKPRSDAVLDLSMAAMNLRKVGGEGFRAIAQAVRSSTSIAVNWSRENEMLDALEDAARLARHEVRTSP
jgi:hypothetical protein